MNLYGYEFQRESDLVHYGVQGMKWGVRRYQNPDGSLIAGGRKRARKEYREDNKQAFELGKDATISARAHQYAIQKANKANARYEKNASYKNLFKKNEADDLQKYWEQRAKDSEKAALNHYNSLKKKYGSAAISSIKRDKTGNINERSHNAYDWLESLGLTAAAAQISILLGSPVIPIFTPATKNQMGKRAYKDSKIRR